MAAQPHDSVNSAQNPSNLDELFEFLTEGDIASNVTSNSVHEPATLTATSSSGEASIYHGNSREEVSERLRLLLLDLLQLEEGVGEEVSLDLAAERSVLWLKFKQLEHDLYDAATLSTVLSPALEHQINQSPEALALTLSKIVDRMIDLQNEQNPSAMSRALAVAIPGAISKQLGDAPSEVIEAIAPAMGKAIAAQVRLDEDAMIDALYPVIGNTISKYMGEVVNQINQRLEAAFSPKRLVRHLWLRLRGISEAEMILRDAVPFRVQAAFLIHKASGLVIAEVQQTDGDTLEGDLLAGMLTAIRSFASDCATGDAHHSELTKIDYEDSQIIMEVAGSCYIAAVVQGDPPPDFFQQLRQVLSAMILNHGYGEYLEGFNGDPSQVPTSIRDLLTTLVNTPGVTAPQLQKPLIPPGALRAIAITVLLLGIPLGGLWYWRASQLALEQKIQQAIQQTPDLEIYRLTVDVRPRRIVLQGMVPYGSLREQTAAIVGQMAPNYRLENRITAQSTPPPPEAIADQLQQTAQVIRQLLGVELVTTYDGQLQQAVVQTSTVTATQKQKLYEAFGTLEGVKMLVVEVATHRRPWQQRIYFDLDEAQIASEDVQTILMPLVKHLQANPQQRLNIVGHTDDRGERPYNEELAARRAAAVQRILIEQGITPSRLFPQGSIDAPPQVLKDDPMSKSRCVRFEIVEIES